MLLANTVVGAIQSTTPILDQADSSSRLRAPAGGLGRSHDICSGRTLYAQRHQRIVHFILMNPEYLLPFFCTKTGGTILAFRQSLVAALCIRGGMGYGISPSLGEGHWWSISYTTTA